MKRVLIIGATSQIAKETARVFALDKADIYLLARDEQKLKVLSEDLKVRGAGSVSYAAFDALEFSSHETALKAATAALGELDIVLIAYGTLPDQAKCENSYEETEREIKNNFLSVVSLSTILANQMEKAGKGCLAVITSVAGDRGRKSNYVYGAAKGGLGIFLQGLRNRLCSKGVCVLTIKPGFVDTPMTAHLKHGPLYAKPDAVARDIHKAILKKKDVLYTPWFWRCIMLIIKHIPEFIFKKMSL